MERIASVRVDPSRATGAIHLRRLVAVLLAGSPRIALVGPGLGRVDARGWGRRGGEAALARALRDAASGAGLPEARVGIADVAVAADAASWLAGVSGPAGPGILRQERGTIIVASGAEREFLAPLPLRVLPLPEDLAETLRAVGFRRVGDLAGRERSELEARFGPVGSRAHRLACGEDDRIFEAVKHESSPGASLDLNGATDTLEPLLFVLRHLLDRVCADLSRPGVCAARLSLELTLTDGTRRRASISPARPTRQERLLYDLCRAALERAGGEGGRLAAPVCGLALRVERVAPPGARQGDLFVGEWRDPMAAAAALSRLQARLGEDAVVWPRPRSAHRPERRSMWSPVVMDSPAAPEARAGAGRSVSRPRVCGVTGPGAWEDMTKGLDDEPASSVLQLLPEPVGVRVRMDGGRPVELYGPGGLQHLVAAEGPERLSGEWWKDPYHREYYRVCTAEGELLWVFREYRRSGELRWWLHGWWD